MSSDVSTILVLLKTLVLYFFYFWKSRERRKKKKEKRKRKEIVLGEDIGSYKGIDQDRVSTHLNVWSLHIGFEDSLI